MNDFNDEELINLIQVAETLTEEARTSLRTRIADALDKGELSKVLRAELMELFEKEMENLEKNLIPNSNKEYKELSNQRETQVAAIRPDLEELVDEYERETAAIMKEYEEGFREIDSEFDDAVQEALAHKEHSEIEAIQAKLKKK